MKCLVVLTVIGLFNSAVNLLLLWGVNSYLKTSGI